MSVGQAYYSALRDCANPDGRFKIGTLFGRNPRIDECHRLMVMKGLEKRKECLNCEAEDCRLKCSGL